MLVLPSHLISSILGNFSMLFVCVCGFLLWFFFFFFLGGGGVKLFTSIGMYLMHTYFVVDEKRLCYRHIV